MRYTTEQIEGVVSEMKRAFDAYINTGKPFPTWGEVYGGNKTQLLESYLPQKDKWVWSCYSCNDIKKTVAYFPPELKKVGIGYVFNRWLTVYRSAIDEHLFEIQPNVRSIERKEAKGKDIIISTPQCNYVFDVKSTRLPITYEGYESIIELLRDGIVDEDECSNLAAWFYANQSTGVRYGEENRLFIVTVPRKRVETIQIDLNVGAREAAIKDFCEHFYNKPNLVWNGSKNKPLWRIIFLVENEDKTITHLIC